MVGQLRKVWFQSQDFKHFRAVPFITLWGIWLARNADLFEDWNMQTLQVSSQICAFSQFFQSKEKVPKNRVVSELVVDKTNPWGFFDGICQGAENACGTGG